MARSLSDLNRQMIGNKKNSRQFFFSIFYFFSSFLARDKRKNVWPCGFFGRGKVWGQNEWIKARMMETLRR